MAFIDATSAGQFGTANLGNADGQRVVFNRFTTGTASAGYELNSVEMFTDSGGSVVDISIYADTSGAPGNVLGMSTVTAITGRTTATFSPAITLESMTSYFVSFSALNVATFDIQTSVTVSTNGGWLLHQGTLLVRSSPSIEDPRTISGQLLRITIRATVKTPAVSLAAAAGDDATSIEGMTVMLDGSGSTGTAVSYQWTLMANTFADGTSAEQTINLMDATTATPTFIAPMNLVRDVQLTFRLSVSEPDAPQTTMTDNVVITVNAGGNDAPTATVGNNRAVTEGATVTLTGDGSDPENEALTYAWTQSESTPSGMTVALNNANTATPTFTAHSQLVNDVMLTFQLTVKDNRELASAATTVVITVNAGGNDAPTATVGNNRAVTEGATVTLTGDGSDPENEALTYAWTQSESTPSGMTVALNNANTATPTFTAHSQLVNDVMLTFQLTVEDNRELVSAAVTVVITVNAGGNDAPTATVGNNRAVTEGATVTLTGDGSDPENEALTYAWTQSESTPSGMTVALNNANTATPTFTAPDQLEADASLTFQLTTRDSRTVSPAGNTDDVVITVNAGPNADPTPMTGNNRTVTEGVAVILSGVGSTDLEGSDLTYTWSFVNSMPTGRTVVLAGAANAVMRTFTAPTQLVDDTILTFRLSVADGFGGDATTMEGVAKTPLPLAIG